MQELFNLMRYNITSGWLGIKLGLDPEKIELFIVYDLDKYVKRPREEKAALADSVEFVYPNTNPKNDTGTKRIVLGPNDVKVDEKTYVNAGYASQEYRDFADKNASRTSPEP